MATDSPILGQSSYLIISLLPAGSMAYNRLPLCPSMKCQVNSRCSINVLSGEIKLVPFTETRFRRGIKENQDLDLKLVKGREEKWESTFIRRLLDAWRYANSI